VNTGRAVITGAGGGVGALLVKRFADNGDTVVATDANAGALERLCDGLSHSGRLIVETAGISSEEDCRRLAESARQVGGHVDVLINCAGFFPITAFEAISVEDWHKARHQPDRVVPHGPGVPAADEE
jgi:NAD(P)-dependent dehydrogenase (short-subunit alcohol dehydrogenase family)